MRRQLAIVHNPVYGGGWNQTIRLARPLRDEHGWETFAAVPDLPEARESLERVQAGGLPVDLITLHRLRKSPDPRPHVALAATFRREVRALRERIRRDDIDLVQAFGPTNPHLALAGHLEGKAVVWSIYDTVLPPKLVRWPMHMVTRWADVVLTTGRALADDHPGATSLGERCITVYPPVDIDAFGASAERRAAARAELGVPDDALVIGTVGNRNPTKGHDGLVRAAALLRGRGHDVWVRVLGQPSPAHAEDMARVDAVVEELGMGDRVAFVNPGRRVPDLLPALDVFVISSVPRSEGVPTVIFEAMATSLPVVATDVGGIAEVVEEGVVGSVVPPLDDAALAAGLERYLVDPQLRERCGSVGRERAESRYRTERCAEVYARAFDLALEHRAQR